MPSIFLRKKYLALTFLSHAQIAATHFKVHTADTNPVLTSARLCWFAAVAVGGIAALPTAVCGALPYNVHLCGVR